MSVLHCPKCGAPMAVSEKTGTMWCPDGGMELTKRTNDRLVACYVTGTQSPKEIHLPIKVGGRWFCPGCGTSCQESQPGLVRCETCGKNMTGFLYELIELHWHR